MKRHLLSSVAFFLLLPLYFLFSGIIYDIPVGNIQYDIIETNGFKRIVIPGSASPFEPGSPELPAISYNYLLPYSQVLTEVSILETEWREITGTFYLYPTQKATVISEDHEFTPPDSHVYCRNSSYPEHILISTCSGNMRGYQIGQICFVPFRYIPAQGKLYILEKLIVEFETEEGEIGICPKRQTGLAKTMVDRVIAYTVVNKSAVNDLDIKPPFDVEENTCDLAPTSLPSLLGAPVDLLIITTNTQYSAYEDLSRLKKLLGYNSAVKTLSWIRQNYAGIDDAERVRNFIKEAVENWGVLYVLIAGDVPGIPTRWIWASPLYDQWPVHIVTDLYFSDLDGNWDNDGDAKFGEVEDSIDFFPDVFVGRLPTNCSDEVHDYIGKLTSYLHPANIEIHTKALFFTSDFDIPYDAYQMALRLSGHLPQHFSMSFLNEKSLGELEDSICSGFGLITGLGHGGVNLIRVRNSPRKHATNFFFDSLVNISKYAMMCVITCYTNPYQSDCLSKHWLLNSHGGGIAYIGPTGYSEAYLHEQYTTMQFDSLFYYPLAAVLAKSKIPYVSQSQTDNWYRLYQFSLALLGDPTLTLWDSIPQLYDSVCVSPDTIEIGIDTVVIDLYPPVPFEVVFYKEGETFVRDSTVTGVLQRCVTTESAGYLKFTVMTDGYVSYTDSILVEPVAPYLVYGDHTIWDTLHNADGMINPGEDISLTLVLENRGSLVASGVRVQLVCGDTLLTMVNDTSSYGNIGAGGSGVNLTLLHFVVSEYMLDGHTFDFELNIDYSGVSSRDSFQLIGYAPALIHFTQEYSAEGDTFTIVPYLTNHGHSTADSVYGLLSVYSDTVVVVDSDVAFPDIEPNGVVSSAPDCFKVYVDPTGSVVRYNFQVYDGGIEVFARDVVLGTVVRPDSLRALGRRHSVVLEWISVSGAVGYRVYRAPAHGGPYTFLANHLEPISYLEDFNVQPGVDYYYYVRAVDSSMNHGEPSDTVCGGVNPMLASGWPQTVYDYLFSSPNFADIDPAYPGLEIVVCGKEGYVYAWHYDGTPVIGNGRIFDIYPAEVWSSPAIGDVDGNGLPDIVFGVRRSTDNLYLISSQGICLPGWPKSLSGSIIGSPVLADIDNDGDLEIFIWTFNADVYAFHHDGSGVYSSNGLLKNLPGISFGSLAIGDINRDGDLEIVCCGGSGGDSLYVWDRFGNYLEPFPLFVQPRGLRYSVVLGDVLGDEQLEICFYADSTERVYVVGADGGMIWSRELYGVADVEGSPVIADITGDVCPEIICAYQSGLTVFDSLGNTLPGFPDLSHDAKLPVVADADFNDDIEILTGSADWHLYAYKSGGQQASGFPILFSNRMESSPAIYDIDLDGRLELMISSNDYKFYVFDLETDWVEWPRFRYDPHNTGTYKSNNLPGILVKPDDFKIAGFGIQTYPNPFRISLSISLQMGDKARSAEDITLKIYDVTGRLVKDLNVPCFIRCPTLELIWYGDDAHEREVSSGVYFVRLETQDRGVIKKIVKVR